MTLAHLSVGKVARIKSIAGDHAVRMRLAGLGLQVGRQVAVVRRKGALQVRIGHTDVLMRHEQANFIGLSE